MLSRGTRRGWRRGFTLIEVLIVVVILAVLAATVVPQYKDVTNDAKYNTTVFNLQGMRAQIELYKAQHNGNPPAALSDLTISTDVSGAPGPDYGPYMINIPTENITGSSTTSAQSPINVTGTTGGWAYDAASGEVRINHTSYSTL
ncbi:MAG: prepilin-type N-terminal cleavage/methylation domain-containing protein [Planctomycetales bacterium]|nr:prepilin-type N-terminal cleavage/methylation domain-containing protein [Planctomycetales bacterium]